MKQFQAKIIINKLGATGTPPEFGIEDFTVGLNTYLNVIEEEYLENFISMGASAFKLVIGSYGGGKTHFLYSIRNRSWKHGYAVSYVPLSPGECPFSKFELVYKSIVSNLMYPMDWEDIMKPSERGIDGFLRNWFVRKISEFQTSQKRDLLIDTYLKSIGGIESSSFTNAVRNAFYTLYKGDEEKYERILQWLKGEDIDRETKNQFRITERLDRTTAFRLIRSLAQWIKIIDYSGLILLFDEAERGISISSSRERRTALDNLRQIIDECGNSRLPGVMIFYAIPDEKQLLEERLEIYEALRQRLMGILSQSNPSGVRIDLEKLEILPLEFLMELGRKLFKIYRIAYPNLSIPIETIEAAIANLARVAYQQRYADISYRRIFVKTIISAFHFLRENPDAMISAPQAQKLIKEGIKSIETQIVEETEVS
jgi:hypothetical protein